jgi:hypothetical protein
LKNISLWIPFFLALAFALLGTALFAEVRLWAFAPFLAIVHHRMTLIKTLWISCICGLFLDCLSSQFHFGLFSLNHVAASLILYRYRKSFFAEKAIAFSLHSTVIAIFLSFFLLLFSSWSHEISWSIPLLFSDVILMPFLDGLYALIWFTCPISLFVYLKKNGLKNLLSRKESQYETY